MFSACCTARGFRWRNWRFRPSDQDLPPGTLGKPVKNPRKVWRIFASNYYLFRGTPSRLWLDYVFEKLFGLKERLSGDDGGSLLRHDSRRSWVKKEFFAARAV